MKRSMFVPCVLFAVLCFPGQPQTALAAINWSGDIYPVYPVKPYNPREWTSSTTGYIGRSSDGTLTVDSGSVLLSGSGYIGNNVAATGEVTVTGTGSSWDIDRQLSVGHRGNGTLNIADGAGVLVGVATHVAYEEGSSGLIHFARRYADHGFALGVIGQPDGHGYDPHARLGERRRSGVRFGNGSESYAYAQQRGGSEHCLGSRHERLGQRGPPWRGLSGQQFADRSRRTHGPRGGRLRWL